MEIVSIDTRLFDEMIRRVKSVEEKAVALCRSQEDLGLKKWLDNQEVCEILGNIPAYPANLSGEGFVGV